MNHLEILDQKDVEIKILVKKVKWQRNFYTSQKKEAKTKAT